MRRIIIAVAVVALVIVVAIGVAVFYSASIVQQVLERAGSHVMGVEVRLREVELRDVLSGTVTVRGVSVANPSGFHSDYAVQVGSVSATLDPASLRSDPLVIHEIVIEAPSIIYEYTEGRSNLGEIQDHVNAYMETRRPEEPEPAEGRPVVVENLRIRDGRATVIATRLDREETVAVPPVHLTDLGTDTEGITPAAIIARVYAELHGHLVRAVAELAIPEVSAHAERARVEVEAMADEIRERAREEATERIRRLFE